jgi:hypothetical protein
VSRLLALKAPLCRCTSDEGAGKGKRYEAPPALGARKGVFLIYLDIIEKGDLVIYLDIKI